MGIDFSELGERLRAARAAREISQEAAAHAVGKSASAIHRLEKRGSGKTTVETVAGLAALYRASVDWLLLGRREPDYPGWLAFIDEAARWTDGPLTDWERETLASLVFPGEWMPTLDLYMRLLSDIRFERARDEALRAAEQDRAAHSR